MFNYISERIPELKSKDLQSHFRKLNVPAKTILLREGDTAQKIFFIEEGCLRLGFYHKAKDISFQFFFENQAVSSIESFRSGKPSQFFIESIEPAKIIYVTKRSFDNLTAEYPEILTYLNEFLRTRMADYSSLFLSFIRDTPMERYTALLEKHPEIIQRVPQRYIASYLGITPVSLSRIRKRCSTSHLIK